MKGDDAVVEAEVLGVSGVSGLIGISLYTLFAALKRLRRGVLSRRPATEDM